MAFCQVLLVVELPSPFWLVLVSNKFEKSEEMDYLSHISLLSPRAEVERLTCDVVRSNLSDKILFAAACSQSFLTAPRSHQK